MLRRTPPAARWWSYMHDGTQPGGDLLLLVSWLRNTERSRELWPSARQPRGQALAYVLREAVCLDRASTRLQIGRGPAGTHTWRQDNVTLQHLVQSGAYDAR